MSVEHYLNYVPKSLIDKLDRLVPNIIVLIFLIKLNLNV